MIFLLVGVLELLFEVRLINVFFILFILEFVFCFFVGGLFCVLRIRDVLLNKYKIFEYEEKIYEII